MAERRLIVRVVLLLTIFAGAPAVGQLRVVASTTDLAEFVAAVGKEHVTVDHIVRGDQNPHYLEIKPSYMIRLKSADLFFIVGLRLELWAQQVVDGSRNSRLRVIECSRNIVPLDVPSGPVDARAGDVHPLGNPHYWLDPENVPVILRTIVDALSEADPAHAEAYEGNAAAYGAHVRSRATEWSARLAPFAGMEMVTYHSSFSYFASRFGIVVAGYVEPKPGIPPTPRHTSELIAMMRKHRIGVIAVEQYYDDAVPSVVAGNAGAVVVRLYTSTLATEGVPTYVSLMDYNVRTLEGAFGRQTTRK